MFSVSGYLDANAERQILILRDSNQVVKNGDFSQLTNQVIVILRLYHSQPALEFVIFRGGACHYFGLHSRLCSLFVSDAVSASEAHQIFNFNGYICFP